jgi:cadmium resistance protein CadD (predicted permease)
VTQSLREILAAVVVFAGTNLDDVIVLTVLFLSSRAKGKPRPWQIWAGQYVGMGLLVVLSAGAALGFSVVPDRWVGLLGFVPIALGVRGLVKAARSCSDEDDAPIAAGLGSVAAVTIANGADNISVYAPMFRMNGREANIIAILVFAALVAVWCLAASWLGSHPRVIALLERFGHWLVPLVFIAIGAVMIGAVILVESGVVRQLSPWFDAFSKNVVNEGKTKFARASVPR